MKKQHLMMLGAFALVLAILALNKRRANRVVTGNDFALDIPQIQPVSFTINSYGLEGLQSPLPVTRFGSYTAKGSCKCQ